VCTRPCWKATGTSGDAYENPLGAPDGIGTLTLKAGAAGKSLAMVKGKGAALALPSLPLELPITAQLQSTNGACLDATFWRATLNTGQKLKAKSE
jgi:hypothetical protein